jgi:heme oxygenase (biliverdin-IX-beta and delta-forming)
MVQAHEFLRENTRDCHSRVDSVFARFNLGDANSYRDFLTSHSVAVSPIEGVLAGADSLPPWRPRLALLEADLRGLGGDLPISLALVRASGLGELAGLLYVIEGSRLGGGVLAKRVGEGLPTSYLSAVHQQGEWRGLLAAIDEQAAAEPSVWLDDALAGARRAFDLFAEAGAG